MIKKEIANRCVVTLETPNFKKIYWIEQTTDSNGCRQYQNRSLIIPRKTRVFPQYKSILKH